ncbi:MAG TPA: hypothetical protein P5056_02900 [Candidatus Paceibacterota bacterium]|nr:hypothetical protein [Candidatus Paceibacterota bacterium]
MKSANEYIREFNAFAKDNKDWALRMIFLGFLAEMMEAPCIADKNLSAKEKEKRQKDFLSFLDGQDAKWKAISIATKGAVVKNGFKALLLKHFPHIFNNWRIRKLLST